MDLPDAPEVIMAPVGPEKRIVAVQVIARQQIYLEVTEPDPLYELEAKILQGIRHDAVEITSMKITGPGLDAAGWRRGNNIAPIVLGDNAVMSVANRDNPTTILSLWKKTRDESGYQGLSNAASDDELEITVRPHAPNQPKQQGGSRDSTSATTAPPQQKKTQQEKNKKKEKKSMRLRRLDNEEARRQREAAILMGPSMPTPTPKSKGKEKAKSEPMLRQVKLEESGVQIDNTSSTMIGNRTPGRGGAMLDRLAGISTPNFALHLNQCGINHALRLHSRRVSVKMRYRRAKAEKRRWAELAGGDGNNGDGQQQITDDAKMDNIAQVLQGL